MSKEGISAAASIRFEHKARTDWGRRFGIEDIPTRKDFGKEPDKKIPTKSVIYDNSVGHATNSWYNRFGE